MAYLMDLNPGKCSRCRIKNAVVQLINRFNGTMGKYCRACGKKACAELNKRERRDDGIGGVAHGI